MVSEPIKGPIVSGVSAIYLLSIVIRHNSCYLSKRGHLHELSLGPLDKTRSQCFTSKEARHLAIAEGRIKARPLQMYHGEWDMACWSEMSVKKGPVTLLSVVQTANKLRLLIAEAESVPGPILEIGNTNSGYRFPVGARRFIEGWNAEGPAHQCAVGSVT